MHIQSDYQEISPKKDNLKNVIKLYYTHKSLDSDNIERITYFPNYVNTLNVYYNSKVTFNHLSRTHQKENNGQYLKLLVGKFDKSREIIMKGEYDKLTIVFHTLGFNHFIQKNLASVVKDHFSVFHGFGAGFDQTLKEVFEQNSIENKRDLLDDYFSQNQLGFEENRILKAVESIFNSNGEILVEDLSKQMNISRKTMLRLFKDHLCMSPSDFKSIVKFRTALTTYESKSKKLNLSSLAYESSYYDQSDFNFNVKTKTGLTPKELFTQIENIAKDLYWKLDYVPKVQDFKS